MKNLLAGVAIAALYSASAYAADLPAKASFFKAPPVPLYNWTSFYAGANAGIGVGGIKKTTIDTGFAGGAQVGFNWQFSPQWVTGIEGDIGYLGISGSSLTEGTAEIKTSWYGTARGRLGYTNGPSLFYATGGAAFVHVKNTLDLSAVSLPSSSNVKTESGWTAGGGIETLLGGNWSAKAEYLYIDAGHQDIFFPVLGSAIRFDNRFHVYRYGLNYKFGGPTTVSGLPIHNWSGFYVGVNAGAAISQVHYNIPSLTGGIDDARFSGGGQLGYNWQFAPQWVAGLESDIGFLDLKRSIDVGPTVGVKTNWYGTVRGRAGYSTGPALLYITGGAAFVNVKNSVESNITPFIFVAKSETATGWTLGGGIETVLAQNWTAKTEYLYIDAGSQDVVNANAIPDGNNTAHFDNRFHVFRFGLNYQFGG